MQSPHAPVRPEWLAQVNEAPLDPQRAIIDAHHHLWDRPGHRYLAEEYLADMACGHRLVASVYIQCRSMLAIDRAEPFQAVGEVEYANGVAAYSASGLLGEVRLCAAIVGGANLMLGDTVAPVLDEMLQRAGPRLRGIRNTTAWHPDPRLVSNPRPPPAGLLREPAFRRGLAQLVRRSLVLDIWAYHTQLGEVLALARAFPDLTIVVDHLAGPLGAGPYAGRRAEVFEHWSSDLNRLAQCPNVHLKLGGLGMKVVGFDLHHEARPPGSMALADLWRPYLLHAIDTFGVERCMFESNFPVDKGMFGYGVLWNTFKRVVADFTDGEKNRLFSGTALDVYRIDSTSIAVAD
ncbi:amidohydrolase family protein [Pantoea sp. Ap-967]|uniref:amidohydrolase family protein n=1 Tax=Pantoea sp. Ap-967 TaxID=2608362 RepID=UPI001421CED9|nr:amidohydrolase family protein [Pantoea sp. Ap-967]NIE73577.1 amidohydrolase family protein [Pantoea sp. Ap-967]